MYHPLTSKTIERISAAQTPVRPATLEERLEILIDLIEGADRRGATPEMVARWQDEAEKIELEIECRKAIEIVAVNTNYFLEFRRAIAKAYADELFYLDTPEPTDDDLRAIEAEQAEKIDLWLIGNTLTSYPKEWDESDSSPDQLAGNNTQGE